MATAWSFDWDCELKVKPGLCGRTWFEAREVPASVGGMRWECALPEAAAESLALAVESRESGQGEGWATDPCGDEVIITVKRGRFKLSRGEADDLAESIRKALAWKEAHS